MKSTKPSPDGNNYNQPKNGLPNIKVEPIVDFTKKADRLMKKYASLVDEIGALVRELRTNPTKGTPIGHSCYKIRLGIKSKGKGKSGGARVITYYYIHGSTVYLLTIYDKAEQEDIPDKKIAELLQEIKEAE
jgi:mRNA-degrading endonuclease RelE of RelBE toxin-antitoxin system